VRNIIKLQCHYHFIAVDGGNDNISRHDDLRRLWELFAFSGSELFFASYRLDRGWNTCLYNCFYGMLRRAQRKHLYGSCG